MYVCVSFYFLKNSLTTVALHRHRKYLMIFLLLFQFSSSLSYWYRTRSMLTLQFRKYINYWNIQKTKILNVLILSSSSAPWCVCVIALSAFCYYLIHSTLLNYRRRGLGQYIKSVLPRCWYFILTTVSIISFFSSFHQEREREKGTTKYENRSFFHFLIFCSFIFFLYLTQFCCVCVFLFLPPYFINFQGNNIELLKWLFLCSFGMCVCEFFLCIYVLFSFVHSFVFLFLLFIWL